MAFTSWAQHHFVAIGKPEWQVSKASHWQQATTEIMCCDHSNIACSHHIYMGVILHAHPVCGESYIQCNANREVAKVADRAGTHLILSSEIAANIISLIIVKSFEIFMVFIRNVYLN